MPTLNLQIAAEALDSDETEAGVCHIEAATTLLTAVAGGTNKKKLGLRFTGVTIPPGATITSAVLSVWVNAKTAIDVAVNAAAEDNAAALTNTAKNLNRTQTKEARAWTATATVGAYNAAPDIKGVLQEVINRAGWASGNALALMLFTREGCLITFENWDNKKNTERSAKLEITYTVGVFVDSASGTATATGTVAESKVTTDTRTGTPAVSGARTETLAHTGALAGAGTVSGSSTSVHAFVDARAASATATGTATGKHVFTNGPLGTVTATGSSTGLHVYTDARSLAAAGAGTLTDSWTVGVNALGLQITVENLRAVDIDVTDMRAVDITVVNERAIDIGSEAL